MEKIKVSVVSYLNSKPFIYGLQNSEIINEIDLSLDIPSDCANKLIQNEVEIGLIPVAVLPLLKEKHIISDYCIGAEGAVKSVMLYSDVPLENIETIFLDYQSRTSVQLIQVLAANYWKIRPVFENAKSGYENKISNATAALVIGDRTFELNGKFAFEYDLSEEWFKFTKLPFVFACWVSNKQLSEEFLNKFNKALSEGIKNKTQLIDSLKNANNSSFDLENYLNQHIHFELDNRKRQALELFLSYISK